jgi:endoglucanase
MKLKVIAIVIGIYFVLGCKKAADSVVKTELPDAPVPAADTVLSSTANFKGVNWADERDNFVNDWLVISGINTTDEEPVLLAKTDMVIDMLKSKGANTVRLPINPPTVMQNFWTKYSSIITRLSKSGIKVVLAYWESAASKDGKVDDMTAFQKMWDKVVYRYQYNANVYFEIMNEPHGYGVNELKDLYNNWIISYNISHRRMILDGAGYATDVNSIGDDSRFSGCLLSFHFYTWFNGDYKTTADWATPVASLKYPQRTIVTEFGAPMTTGKNYTGSPGFDKEIAYIQGMSDQLRKSKVGSIYWPGIRTNDNYSMFTINNSVINTNNTGGLKQLQYAWNEGTLGTKAPVFDINRNYSVINRNSNKSLDVSGSSLENGASVIQWDFLNASNQLWLMNLTPDGYYNIINKHSNKFLDMQGASTSGGSKVLQWENNMQLSQQWEITDIGFGYYKIINRNSGLSLDMNGGEVNNGASAIQWYWNRGHNQQWQIKENL